MEKSDISKSMELPQFEDADYQQDMRRDKLTTMELMRNELSEIDLRRRARMDAMRQKEAEKDASAANETKTKELADE